MVLLVEHPPGREAERRYVLDVLLGEFLGLDHETRPWAGTTTRVTLRGEADAVALHLADVLFALPPERWLTRDSLPRRPLAEWAPPPEWAGDPGPSAVPVLYARPGEDGLFHTAGGQVSVGVDLLGGAFFLLTRYEEAVTEDERDGWDRFLPSASVTGEAGLLTRPLVNEYLEILWGLLRRLWPELRRKERSYRLLLSHDVDAVSSRARTVPSVLRTLGADLLIRREPRLAARRLGAYVVSRCTRRVVDSDPYNTFDFIMATSEAAGVRSAFNFAAGTSDPAFDPDYGFEEDWVRGLIRRIARRGHEVGFHASLGTYRDPERTRSEYRTFRRVCEEEGVRQDRWGGRQHYLRWHNPTTWRNWEDCGLDYDSSLTYAQHVGFRCGCCYEYPVFDVRAGKRLRLRERPLVAMESSLLSYMGCPLPRVEQWLGRLAALCRRYRGDFTLLWHNHMLVGKDAQLGYQRVVRAAAG